MRIVKEQGYKEYQYALKSIDDDFKNGLLTREEAKKSVEKLRQRYKNNEVNKDIAKAVNRSKNSYLLKG